MFYACAMGIMRRYVYISNECNPRKSIKIDHDVESKLCSKDKPKFYRVVRLVSKIAMYTHDLLQNQMDCAQSSNK